MTDRMSLIEAKERRRRTYARGVKFLVFFLAISFLFSMALVFRVYQVLDDKITSLSNTAAENITAVEIVPDGDDDVAKTITVTVANMTDVADELASIKAQLSSQEKEILRLDYLIDSALNVTVARLNSTIEGVQKEVNSQVQQVNDNVSSQNSLMAYQFAGTFAILGSLISIWHISNHLRALNEPIVQRKIVAILWMIPIFSMTSWLGLVFVSAEGYLGLIKDFYEAYCIYTFLSFIIAVLGRGDRDSVIDLLSTRANHLRPPIQFAFWKKRKRFDSPRHKAEAVLVQCQLFAMQFVFVRPLTSVAMLIADIFWVSRWDWRYPQFYVMMTMNLSVFFAFTGLVKIYHAIRDELAWCHPFSKFLCIKGVVFMTFWQGVVISFIAQAVSKRRENDDDDWDATEWSKEAQSFLICLEMFFFAIIHCFVFPAEQWEEGYKEKELIRDKPKLGDNLALRDFFKDVKLVMRRKKIQRSKASRMTNMRSSGNETTFGDQRQDVELEVDLDWSGGWGQIERYIDILEDDTMEEDDGRSETSTIKSDEKVKSDEKDDSGGSSLTIV